MIHLTIAATGNIGTEVVKTLARSNRPVIAAGRDLQKVKDHFKLQGIKYRSFDLTDPGTWDQALEGVGRMFLVVPPGSASEEQQSAFFKKAQQANVQHVVYSSGRTTGPVEGSPLNITEGLVKDSGINWTILRPGWFMQNFINWYGAVIKSEGAVYTPAGEAKTAFVDVRDISAVVAEILVNTTGHEGKMYDITGPDAIDHFRVAEHIARVTGRKVEYVSLDDEDFVDKMTTYGWGEKKAQKIAGLYDVVRKGEEAAVSHAATEILGRQPANFRQFADDHAEAWKK